MLKIQISKIALFFTIYFLFACNSIATAGSPDYKAYVGLSIPTGSILASGDDYDNEMTMGFGPGFEISFPFMKKRLNWINNISFSYHGHEYDSYYVDESINGDNYCKDETGYWYHLPISSGLSYNFFSIGDFKLSFSGQTALNINKTFEVTHTDKLDSGYSRGYLKTEVGISFGFVLGFEVIYKERYKFNISYYNFGKNNSEIKMTRYEGENLSEMVLVDELTGDGYDVSISYIMINLGIKLN